MFIPHDYTARIKDRMGSSTNTYVLTYNTYTYIEHTGKAKRMIIYVEKMN